MRNIYVAWCILILSIVTIKHRCTALGKEELRVTEANDVQPSARTTISAAFFDSSTGNSFVAVESRFIDHQSKTNQSKTVQATQFPPSDVPSLTPSAWPSYSSPTIGAVVATSDTPSMVPSWIALIRASSLSAAPSDVPSLVPSTAPSVQASLATSHTKTSDSPSISPSLPNVILQSDYPSLSPSGIPSNVPSKHPSFRPSSTPTRPPSRKPSSMPTFVPSPLPSFQPSGLPSSTPSHLPSQLPSNAPSTIPSQYPSKRPSDRPSMLPSASPSEAPSSRPSSGPSSSPSHFPSINPSRSSSPSSHPSMLPSSYPSQYPSAGPRNMSATGSTLLTGVSTTMNAGNITVFENTARKFLSRQMTQTNGAQVDISSVTVVGQSLVGSSRRALQQSSSSLSVRYLVDAVILPGDPVNFSLTEEVSQTFTSKSNDFQEWLSIASPFFPSPYVVQPRTTSSSSSSSKTRTTAVYVSTGASFILLVAFVFMGAWIRRRCRAEKNNSGPYLSMVGSTLTAGSEDLKIISNDWILGGEADPNRLSPTVFLSSQATFENIELERRSIDEEESPTEFDPRNYGLPEPEPEDDIDIISQEAVESGTQCKQNEIVKDFGLLSPESHSNFGNMISWLKLATAAEDDKPITNDDFPAPTQAKTVDVAIDCIDEEAVSIAQSSPAILQHTEAITPNSGQYIQLQGEQFVSSTDEGWNSKASPSNDEHIIVSKETEQSGGRVVAWFQRRRDHLEKEPAQLDAPYFSDEENHVESIGSLDEAVISFTQSSPAALQCAALSSPNSDTDKVERYPEYVEPMVIIDDNDDTHEHAWMVNCTQSDDAREPDRYAKENEEISLGNSEKSVIVEGPIDNEISNRAKKVFIPPNEVISPRKHEATPQAIDSDESKGDGLIALSFSSFESESNSNATTEGSITDQSLLTNDSVYSDAAALVGRQSICSMSREGPSGTFRR